MTNRPRGTLYIGVTGNLRRRLLQHGNNLCPGFTRRYRLPALVWFEVHERMLSALSREKALKEWRRQGKIELIEAVNPQWRDLYHDIA